MAPINSRPTAATVSVAARPVKIEVRPMASQMRDGDRDVVHGSQDACDCFHRKARACRQGRLLQRRPRQDIGVDTQENCREAVCPTRKPIDGPGRVIRMDLIRGHQQCPCGAVAFLGRDQASHTQQGNIAQSSLEALLAILDVVARRPGTLVRSLSIDCRSRLLERRSNPYEAPG